MSSSSLGPEDPDKEKEQWVILYFAGHT